MKKTIIYTAFWLATAGIALTSCEDIFGGFLDKQPSNELTEEEVFSQWTTTREFHFDTYNFLRHGACRINNSWMDAATDLAETSYASGVQVSTSVTIMPAVPPLNLPAHGNTITVVSANAICF